MATVIIGVALAGMVALAIRTIIKNKKEGKHSCGGNCGNCIGKCHAEETCKK